jgi:AAA domain, putative AbiEii toxin, Type IV TA system
MYIERLKLTNVRTFVEETLEFVHPDLTFRPGGEPVANGSPALPRPRLPNVNLLLGDNGSGKSTILRAIAMTALGLALTESRLPTKGLIRRSRADQDENEGHKTAEIHAELLLHEQEHAPGRRHAAGFVLVRKGELEQATFSPDNHSQWVQEPGYQSKSVWEPVFESNNEAFFAVGYGATRRVEAPETLDPAARSKLTFLRGQRLLSLFQESFSLIPLSTWLPRLADSNPGRYKEVEQLLSRLLKPTHCTFTGTWKRENDGLFETGGLNVPFQDLSDGYRAFIGWAADMLFHACHGCSRSKKLVDLRGIVMVDEIDLHLHPRWQMKVISTIARAFPRMQFILTSHSPLVAGSLEWMNIIALKLNRRSNSTHARRLKESIHGLDADQVLLSDFFGLSTTRAESKAKQLDDLTLKASLGDDQAAELLISKMAAGMEESE